MIGKTKSLFQLFVFLAISTLVSCGQRYSEPKVFDAAGHEIQEAGTEFVVKVYKTLQENYYDVPSINDAKLFNAGLDGVSKFLKTKDVEFVPEKIDEKIKYPKAAELFYAEFKKALNLAVKTKDLKKNDLTFAAVSKMLDALDSSHTYFIRTEQYREELKSKNGKPSYSGIGASIRKLEDKFFYLEQVFPQGPAEKAGLKRFDKIVEVDGKKAGNDLREVVQWVRGEKGTEVEIVVERNGEGLTCKVERGDIVLPATQSEILQVGENSFGYLKLYHFDFRMLAGVYGHLHSLDAAKAKGMIIDLRGNPGGSMFVLDLSLELFLKINTPTYIVKEKNGKADFRHTTKEPMTDLPVIILIDEMSGSAAEVFAAVMQENRRAEIVGKNSGGYVSVGNTVELSEGAAMMITISELTTAKGKKLEKKGVAPDVVVELTKDNIEKGQDAQLEKAIELLKAKTAKK